MLIERFRREILSLGYSRTNEAASTYPGVVPPPHLVCLLDENSGSDGDIFPAMFKKAGLGPLIGERSWGGVIGITNRGALMDGGGVNVPEFGFASAEGEWVIEGYGVDPDIEGRERPEVGHRGRQPPTRAHIAGIMAAVEADPRPLSPPRRPRAYEVGDCRAPERRPRPGTPASAGTARRRRAARRISFAGMVRLRAPTHPGKRRTARGPAARCAG